MTYYERNLPTRWRGSVPDLAAGRSLPREYFFREHDPDPGREFVYADRLLDHTATGPLWLKDERIAGCVSDALRFGETTVDLYHLRAWVLMANHVHLLIEPRASLERIKKSVRGYSGRAANQILGRSGIFWQQEGYDHWARDRAERDRIVRYIERNPVKAGLVSEPQDWPWSSAFQH